MKMIVAVALALVAIASAAPVDEPTVILRSENQVEPDGRYKNSFETSNGISQQSVGELKEVIGEDGKPVVVLVTRGQYSYTAPDGKPVLVTYEADEQGYRAESDVIPKTA